MIDSVRLRQRRQHRFVDARRRYAGTLSKQTAELLESFEALAPDEKRIFTAEFLRRAILFDSCPLENEETAHAGKACLPFLTRKRMTARRGEVWLFDLGMAEKEGRGKVNKIGRSVAEKVYW